MGWYNAGMTIISEAQLEAHALTLARAAFPHVEPSGFAIEKTFKLKLGHKGHEHNGAALWTAEGRADLLLFHGGKPLAVIELKREDKTLGPRDLKQGQSYAAILFPRPPLVIVTNGKETWVRQVDDGTPLPGGLDGADVIEKIFENIGKLAAADNSWAIEVLMGPEASVWVEAVRLRTDELIERLTGEPNDTRKPFGRDLLFHRRATVEIIRKFEGGTQAILIEGPPLAGKSNVLRDLALATRASPEWAVLMVNGATVGAGLFQRLATLLGEALEWKLSADDVRVWLRRMSRSSRRPALVLAVDGLKPGSLVAQDLEELAESGFGAGLRLIGCTDRASEILVDNTGRGETALAALAEVIEVESLDDGEFDAFQKHLAQSRILFYPGAELAEEYRNPWLLRAVVAGGPSPEREDVANVIPATMGMSVVRAARLRFKPLHDVVRHHRLLARDALADEENPHPELALAIANAFVIRRDALSPAGEDAAIKLEAQAWVSFYRHPTGEDVVAFRVPELFMSELALELADVVNAAIAAEPDDAWAVLASQAQRFFLGDIVGAQALFDLGKKRGGLPVSLLEPLMNDPPTAESMAGKTIGLQRSDGTIINLRFNEEGAVARADAQGNAVTSYSSVNEDEDAGTMYGDMISWMILSQFARIRTTSGMTIEHRLDIQIMLCVGRAEMPLMRGGDFENLRPHSVQGLGKAGSTLSAEHALAEPLTSAIHGLFHREWRDLDYFFEELVRVNLLPLTCRVHHALYMLQGATAPGLEDWAREKMASIVHPLMQEQIASLAA